MGIENACIQIPSNEDLGQMAQMYTGNEEDQQQRISHMVDALKDNSLLPLITTDHINMPDCWLIFFKAISEGKNKKAKKQFKEISPKNDEIMRSLRQVHSIIYLNNLIDYSIQALETGSVDIGEDILITPKTFELLIKDIATTLKNPSKFCFSFGLPTHHAYYNTGRGFCVLNKTALLMKYWEKIYGNTLKYIIVGTDVNRDDGLCNLLRGYADKMDICHVDIFDSRVYPNQDFSDIDIDIEFRGSGTNAGQKISSWQSNTYIYYAVDLSLTVRKKQEFHPALEFALHKINEQIESAIAENKKISILLPTGWDSHEEETAQCGKWIDDRPMLKQEAHRTRFSEGDLCCFYEKICQLYHENNDHIVNIYWGLEGGYDRAMYQKQIQALLDVFSQNLLNLDAATNSPRKTQ